MALPTPIARTRENRVLTILRRFIPGDYKALNEIDHPLLWEVGLDVASSRVLDPCKQALGLLLQPTLSSRHPLVKAILNQDGGWCLVIDSAMGGDTGASLLLCQVADSPHQTVKALECARRGTEGFILVRPVLDRFIVVVQASILKGVFKQRHV